ncbi:ESX-1 secretion system protein eccB1 [Microbacterium oxydans]|uniref:ESX-1 secretion system protein eccB1 n=1 Tax=Microbacterium oxydans TaxID=82380 RepID=A0A0F0KQE1_9MICO|nr:type VII secretion protein EccB [Microbacterium oxydans]KJL21456.1 ESX-1 secretion system protein eccB1 [Microbacterium oxydans]
MATKKDLIEAQGFSRRRLLSAFTGGAPGGKELDPAKPLRAVVAGVALTVGVILVGVFWGIMQPGLPGDWQNNRLIIATDTGARYVSVEGTLYPVINTASARLLIPAGEFKVVRTDQSALDGIPVGASIGILGAPDDLPAPSALINASWTACVDDSDGTAVSLSNDPIAQVANGSGTVVQRGDELFVVADGLRHAVPADDANAVLRAVGLGTSDVYEVDGRWLNLFDAGADLEPIRLNAVGASVPGTDLTAGTIVHVQGSPADERYVALATGELARLSPLAYQLYLLGSGEEAGAEEEVSPAEVANVPTVPNAGGDDWPTQPLKTLAAGQTPCAVLGDDARTVLGSTTSELPEERSRVDVAVGGGALVQVRGTSDDAVGMAVLVDESGTAYAIPGAVVEPDAEEAASDAIAQLGYSPSDIGRVSNAWIEFFAAGPALTSEAARESPGSGTK